MSMIAHLIQSPQPSQVTGPPRAADLLGPQTATDLIFVGRRVLGRPLASGFFSQSGWVWEKKCFLEKGT